MYTALLIGYGTMGKTHAKKMQGSGKVARLVVIDNNPERLKEAAEAGYEIYPDLDSAYKNPQDFAIVAVTSNTATHYHYVSEIIRRCAAQDLPAPALFVEKPLVATTEEALILRKLLQETCYNSNLKFMCGYLLRESPAVAALIDMINQAQDTIKTVKILWTKKRPATRPSAGVVQDETTHALDLIQYIMRELGLESTEEDLIRYLEVLSTIRTTEIVDPVAQNALYPEGDKSRNPIAEISYRLKLGSVSVEILSSFLTGPQERSMLLVGEKATYQLQFDKDKADWCNGVAFTSDKDTGGKDKIDLSWESFLAMLENDLISRRVANFEEAIRDVKLTNVLEEKADQYLAKQKNSNLLFTFVQQKGIKSRTENKNTYCGFRPGFAGW